MNVYDFEITEKLLIQRLEILRENISFLESFVEQHPSESIKIATTPYGNRFYKRTNKSSANGIYLSGNQTNKIYDILQSGYYKRILVQLRKEETKIKTFLRTSYGHNIQTINSRTSDTRKKLVTLFPEGLRNQLNNIWKSQSVETQPFKQDDPVILTNNNLRVRSKSEREIANELDSYGVPFFYAPKLMLEGYSFFPDFKLRNIRSFKLFYWEHLGMMDDIGYVNHALWKLNLYSRHGIIPGKNLIITMESGNNPLNTQTIRQVIDTFCL